MVGVVGSSPIVPTRQTKKGRASDPFLLRLSQTCRSDSCGELRSDRCRSPRAFSAFGPAPLERCQAVGADQRRGCRLALGRGPGGLLAGGLLRVLSFFFLVPAALPEALRFFGPW